MKKILYALSVLLLAVPAVFIVRSYWEKETIALIDQYIEQHYPTAGTNSEINYLGATTTTPFVAIPPYILNIQGTLVTSELWGASRGFDFSGNVPFINPKTGKADAQTLQAWNSVFANSFSPYLSGSYNLNGDRITNLGFPGRIEKMTINGVPTTMIRYNAFDGLTEGHPRSQLVSYDIPPRTRVRWNFEVAFGNADGTNDWELTTTKASPVLFWQLKNTSQTNPPLLLAVDTDSNDSTKLMITVSQRIGTAQYPTQIGNIMHGIPRHTMIPIVIDAFLDERANVNGGKGFLQISVNNVQIVDQIGPNLGTGSSPHNFDMAVYLFAEQNPFAHTRATFWKTAKMFVFPINTTPPIGDTISPSTPINFVGTTPNSSTVNLTWNPSTDNIGISNYLIYRDDSQIGTTELVNFSDTYVAEGTTYNYKIKAVDASGNLSPVSQTVTVNTPSATPKVNISSFSASNITATTALIKWTTNMPTTGVVSFGKDIKLNDSRTDRTLTTSHSLTINGLSRKTKYFYKITVYTTNLSNVQSSILNFTTK